MQLLTSELEDFRRREPLVQLLWHELVQVKSALEAAVAAGFSYDVGEPSGRYVDLSEVRGVADVNGLDVVRMMEATAARHGRPLNNSSKPGRHSRTVSLRDDSGAAHAMLNDFIPVSLPLAAVEEQPLPPASPEPAALLSPASPGQSIPAPPSAAFLSPVPSAPSSPPFVCAPDAPPAPPGLDVPAAPPCAPGAPGAPDAPAAPLLSLATKGVVVPAKKMKAVHWQRVLIGERKGRAGGLWGEVADEGEPQLDYDELVGRFCDARVSLVKPQRAVAGGKEKEEEKEAAVVEKERELRVLSDKRYNTVSIMMTSLPPVPTVLTAIAQLDSTALSKDQVVALRKNMLDEAETQQFAALPPNAHLSRPDAFMRQLAACDSISARLDCWHFQLHFAELQEEILTPLQAIHAAVSGLRSSVAFRRFMGLILTAGNYMNGNTPRGQADGFELSVLARLGSLRDNDNHTTLLLWLLAQAAEQQGEVFLQQLEEELVAPAAAADFPLKQALSACSRFTALVRTMKNTATLVCASAVDASDPFVSVFAAFNAEADSKAAAVQAQAQEVQRAYAELLLWLNPTATEGGGMGAKGLMASEDLFQVVRELREVVRELRVERREEQEEAARAKRIDDAKRIAAEIKAQQQLKLQQQEADNASRTAQ